MATILIAPITLTLHPALPQCFDQVNWAGRRVDWDHEATPPWLPDGCRWSPDLMSAKRNAIEVVYTKVGIAAV